MQPPSMTRVVGGLGAPRPRDPDRRPVGPAGGPLFTITPSRVEAVHGPSGPLKDGFLAGRLRRLEPAERAALAT